MSKLSIPGEYVKKYGGQGSCEHNSVCDFAYVSDICRLKEGYDCPECPKRKALREQMDKDVANDPEMPKIMEAFHKRNRQK